MDILGIGVPELLLIVLLVLILLGPKDMVATGRMMGRWLNQLIHSPTYKLLTRTGEELKNLPRNLMREANLEEAKKEFEKLGNDVNENVNSIGGAMARSFDERQIFSQPQPGAVKSEQFVSSPSPSATGDEDVQAAADAPGQALKTISTPDLSDPNGDAAS